MQQQSTEEGHQQVAQAATNGFAVASLVLGIVWAMGIGSILALVFGYVAKSQIESSGGKQTGAGMAIAGIVLGWVGVGFIVLWVVLMASGVMSMPSMDMDMMNGGGGMGH